MAPAFLPSRQGRPQLKHPPCTSGRHVLSEQGLWLLEASLTTTKFGLHVHICMNHLCICVSRFVRNVYCVLIVPSPVLGIVQHKAV